MREIRKRWMRVPAAVLVLLAAPCGAGARALESVQGHVAVGYAQLVIRAEHEVLAAPGGSVSFTGGVDFPVATRFRAGLDIGYHLLGSRSVERGSLSTNVSYSAFEAAAFAHWLPERLGPVGRVSLGPALVAAHADLSSAGGGAGFSDLAVGETAPGFAAEVTFISRAPTPVRLGLQLGVLVGYLTDETWTTLSARVTVHY